LKVIKSVGGNAQRAYELLGVPKSTFYDLLKRLDIPRSVLK
jgi:predicted DNA-binding transcriptional regulator AlpA